MPSRPAVQNVEHSPPQPYKDTQYSSGFNSSDKLQSYNRPPTAGEPQYSHGPSVANATAASTHPPLAETSRGRSMEPAPDPLTRAFNDAILPYQEQIQDLQAQLEETNYRLQTLEDERADMHAWIDKRGLRAGMAPSIQHSIILNEALTYHRCPTLHIPGNEHRFRRSSNFELPTRP